MSRSDFKSKPNLDLKSMPPLPDMMIDYGVLQDSYAMECCVCGKFHPYVRPSILMKMRMNGGRCTCQGCDTLLKLAIADCGTKMVSRRWEDWLAEVKAAEAAQ